MKAVISNKTEYGNQHLYDAIGDSGCYFLACGWLALRDDAKVNALLPKAVDSCLQQGYITPDFYINNPIGVYNVFESLGRLGGYINEVNNARHVEKVYFHGGRLQPGDYSLVTHPNVSLIANIQHGTFDHFVVVRPILNADKLVAGFEIVYDPHPGSNTTRQGRIHSFRCISHQRAVSWN